MRRYSSKDFGFTIIELMIAVALVMIVLAMAMTGWSFVFRGERRNSSQCALDIDIRTSIERLRAELRLSDVNQMVYYPQGAGPYIAISFPLPKDDDGDGLVDMEADGEHIRWSQTVIYHIAKGSPDQLLRTVFDPRDNTLSDAQRVEQLERVVADGDGDAAPNGANAETRNIFSNFFDWSIEGKNQLIDAYNPTLSRRAMLFGTALVGPGDHTYSFKVVEKNSESAGYNLGLDTLRVSPSLLSCEAEDQSIVEGADSATRQYMEGSWSGNHHLLYNTGGADADAPLTLEIPCDRWEERNFRASSSTHERTQVVYDQTLGSYLLTLKGKGEAWNAIDQTGSTAPVPSDVGLQGCAVRVRVRGDTATTVGFIRHDGRITGNTTAWTEDRSAVFLEIPPEVAFLGTASIAVASPAGASTLDAVPGTSRSLHLMRLDNTKPTVVGIVGTGGASQQVSIQMTNSYVVSYLVSPSASPAHLPVWNDIRSSNTVSTIVLPGATATDVSATSWSTRTGLVKFAGAIAVNRIVTAYPEDGFFTSQIVDSTIDGNSYENLAIEGPTPTGTSVGVRVRASEAANMTGASAWSAYSLLGDGAGLSSAGSGRHVQFQARLASDPLGAQTPGISLVAIDWAGVTRLIDIGGVVTVGPDYGVFEVSVDGNPLIKGLRIALSIFKDVGGNPPQLTSEMTMEVEPRNTGK